MFRKPVLLLFLLTFPLMIWGGYAATTTFRNELSKWPSPHSQMRREFDRFQAEFHSTDVVMLSWPGCEISDARLPKLERELSSGPEAAFFDFVTSGDSIFATLRNDLNLSRAVSLGRLRGVLIGPDNFQTCLVAALSDHGSNHRAQTIDCLLNAVEQNSIDLENVRIVGPANDLKILDFEGFWSPLRVVPLIGLLAFLFTWMFVQRLGLAIFISAMSSYTGTLALTLVYLSGTPMNALVWTMPTLVLLLTTSAALHFLAYYKDARQRFETEVAPARALQMAWKPILYCAMTTAAGLFSLILSELLPIREFGLFGGVSVLFSCGVVLLLLPVWLAEFPDRRAGQLQLETHRSRWEGWANMCFRFRKPIIGVAVLVIVALAACLPHLDTGVANSDLFQRDSKVMRDAAWFESNVCPLSTIEVVLSFEHAQPAHDVDRFRLLQHLAKEFRSWESVDGVMSAATYAPKIPREGRGAKALLQRRTTESKVKKLKTNLTESGLVGEVDADGFESWRMTLYGTDFTGLRFEELTTRVKSDVDRFFSSVQEKRFSGEGVEVVCTGHAVLMDHVESQFLRDLAVTYATAFVLISLAMFFIMRSWIAVVVATPPNLFPAIVVLGSVAAVGINLDVGSLLTASVALGIAVDDTLHFLLWWREKVRSGMTSRAAIVDAMEHCGVAMIQTTVVCGLSVVLYACCGFLPTVRFGFLLSSMLFLAVVGDLILLPAILSTRLGEMLLTQSRGARAC